METDLQNLHDEFAKRFASAHAKLEAFTASADERGLAKVIGGSDHVFSAAGEVEVYGQLVDALADKLAGDPKTKLTFESLHAYVLNEVINNASWVSHGSSQTGYLFKRCETAAWASALSYIQTGM